MEALSVVNISNATMEGSKKIEVGGTTLLQLKAELARKQEAFRQEKLRGVADKKSTKEAGKKPNIWSKQNAGVLARAQKDLEEKREEEDVMGKSRSKLEAKARFYEQMTKGDHVPDADGSDGGLVDFQQKAIGVILEKRAERIQKEDDEQLAAERREEEAVRARLREAVPAPKDPQEDWVDYVDSLGRSRRCLRKDLADLQAMDRKLAGKSTESVQNLPDSGGKDLMSSDMHRELLREKWEKEMEEQRKSGDPIHYSNVQFDEIRTHGVGYYQFSKEEVQRQEQMKQLSELREQTQQQRERFDKFKAKRKAIMKERLAKIRRRKLLSQGLDPDQVEEDEPADSDEEEAKETPAPELLVREESHKEDVPTREWDFGKKDMSYGNWIENRRSERQQEFAPPSIYGAVESSKHPGKRVYNPPKNLRNLEKLPKPDPNWSQNSKVQETNRAIEATKLQIEAQLKAIRQGEVHIPEKVVTQVTNVAPPAEAKVLYQNALPSSSGTTENITNIPLPPAPHPPIEVSYVQTQLASSKSNAIASDEAVDRHAFSDRMQDNFANVGMGYTHAEPPSLDSHNMVPSTVQYNPHIPPPGYAVDMTSTAPQPMTNVTTLPSNFNVPPPTNFVPNVTTSIPPSLDVASTVADSLTEQTNTNQNSSEVHLSKAPQPVHYSSKPMKPQLTTQPRHERVFLHQVPSTLPAPPSAQNMPMYPSQEQIHTSKTQDKQIADWHKQYNPSGSSHKTVRGDKSIPFPSPYVNSEKK